MAYTSLSLSTVATGEIQGGTTAFRLPSVPCIMVKVKAINSNAGNIYLGSEGVTVPMGTSDSDAGFELAPGDETGWLPIGNLNQLYAICNNNGDDLTYLALR